MNLLYITIGLALLLGLAIVYIVYARFSTENKLKKAEFVAQETLKRTSKEAQDVITKANREAQSIIDKSRTSIENELKERRNSIKDIENRAYEKEKHIAQKETQLNEKEAQISHEQERIKQLKKKQEDLIKDLSSKLEQTAGFTQEEAKSILLSNVERESKQDAGKIIKTMEEQARKIGSQKAKEIVTNAIQRTAVDFVSQATTSNFQLPDDEMKGRIIGKEGRNIRAFESQTGVDVIIDDTPGTITISCFNPIRREIAKLGLQHLVDDGRIHPTRIEEAIEKAEKELEGTIREHGEQAIEKLGIEVHSDMIPYLGRLFYRTSYGQNQLHHAIESAIIAGHMADALGVNAQLAKRGALLHDIGKSIDFEMEGSHDDLGKELCLKYGESDEVINCIMAHHEDEEPDTIEAVLVMIADAISSSRPGARRESMDTYIKRLQKLESIASDFEGVEKAFAIQAGREIRVLVQPDEINDDGVHKLASDIAKKVEDNVDYPGEVKVSIIRETRAVGLAK